MMISAVVLSHNDEKTIIACLESLSWCDEIIVIDDFSIDKTIDIAKKLGARVYQRHLDNDFASQRNFGLSKAKGEWVLFVDSDEVVMESLQNEIKESIQSTKCNGFYLKRRDFIFGRYLRHGETNRVRLLRLAKKEAGDWVRPVHEVWSPYAKASGDKNVIGELNEPLEHFPHQNVAQFLEEINRYSTLNARYLFTQKIGVTWWQVVGYPVGKFFLNYFFYLGFLDGTAGAMIAIFMSFHSFLVRAKLWQLWDKAS